MPVPDRPQSVRPKNAGSAPPRIPPARHPNESQAPRNPPAAGDGGSLTAEPARLQAHLEHLEKRFSELKAQLRHLQKLATLGTTAAMIAHEINNLLTPIMAYAHHALECDDPDLMRTALTKSLEASKSLSRMVDRVVGFARQGDGATRPVPVRNVVEDALGCLARDFTKDQIDVCLEVPPDLAVRANENQLMQVLVNLITNARKAMLGRPGRGRLTIRATAEGEDRVAIQVADTGCGIPPEHIDRVFDPFFTTHAQADRPERRGLGLGLPICRDIIQELGGTIELTSQVGVGTTFTITLPRAD